MFRVVLGYERISATIAHLGLNEFGAQPNPQSEEVYTETPFITDWFYLYARRVFLLTEKLRSVSGCYATD
jgi:hypothetical protein